MVGDSLKFKFSSKKIIILFSLVIILLISTFFLYSNNFQGNKTQYSSFPQIKSSDHILIISPHPDDESLADSGLIQKALEVNASVEVVEMTVGDATPLNATNYTAMNITNFNGSIGDLRHQEAINAMSQLGLNQSNIIFLGYPDTGLSSLWGTNWDYNNLYTNPINNYSHSPYNFSYEPNAPYCGADVDKNLVQIVNKFQPTLIFYPDDGDEHPDHWATSNFVRYVEIQTNFQGIDYCYLVHKSSWPQPLQFAPTLNLTTPTDVLRLDGEWFTLNLTQTEENNKENAILSHVTQIYQMKNYLLSFVRTNEIFAYYPIIPVKKTSMANFGIGMPDSSVADLKYDSKTGILLPSADLTEVGFTYDDYGEAYLFLQTSDNIDYNNFIYDFHLRIYNGTDFNRLDIIDENGTFNEELMANNSIEIDNSSIYNWNEKNLLKSQANILALAIPLEVFNGSNVFIMNTDVKLLNNNTTDETAWRMYYLPPNTINSVSEIEFRLDIYSPWGIIDFPPTTDYHLTL
jgi:LmbE family N-acetylglucosaminyl deacetylase